MPDTNKKSTKVKSLKIITLKANKEINIYIKMELNEIGCEDGSLIKLANVA